MAEETQGTASLILARRIELGWTQAELARQLGRHKNSVCRWEAGCQPTLRSLHDLAAVLGLRVVASGHTSAGRVCGALQRANSD